MKTDTAASAVSSEFALRTRSAATTQKDPVAAVAELKALAHQPDAKLTLCFCSAAYDLDTLAVHLAREFSGPILGCTTAGELGPNGLQQGGVTLVTLAGDLEVSLHSIDLENPDQALQAIGAAALQLPVSPDGCRSFGLLLVDGLSLKEEQLALAIYEALPTVPFVGGSAGDDLRFESTHVLVDGQFRKHWAAFALVTCPTRVAPIKFQHFVPSEEALVVSAADAERRIILELNGEPAVELYARLTGVGVEALTPEHFSSHPIIVEMGGESYVRSIARVTDGGGLAMFCAIDEGVVVSIATATEPMATARRAFEQAREQIGEPALVIGCDCILRRLEFQGSGRVDEIAALHKQFNVVGFSTYGEQYNGVHVNQTFTGIAIARAVA